MRFSNECQIAKVVIDDINGMPRSGLALFPIADSFEGIDNTR